MKVKEVMNKEVKTILPNTPLRMINQLMQKYSLSHLLIVNEKKEVEGIITYSDLFRLVLPSYQKVMQEGLIWLSPEVIEERSRELMDKPVSEFMKRKIISVDSGELVFKAGAEMIANNIKQMPVIENNKLVGVISFHDILWELLMANRP